MKIKGPNIREKDQLTVWKSPKRALRNICMREQKPRVDIRAKRDGTITLDKNNTNIQNEHI